MKLPKTYEPAVYEPDIYALWEKSGSFKPRSKSEKGNFSMVMPPPNANDNLHMGHALMVAIEDIIARYQRMLGKRTLYVPGADHAGFETWVVYEKQLAREGKTRFDFSREELYQQVWDFVELNKFNFNKQLRSLGVSNDWDKFAYTLDKKVVNQAYSMFKQMWREKLIYRGERLVNFCTFHGTSFADIEVVYRQEKGKLWFIKYPIVGEKSFITIATTRPETMLGDTAVAVNPKDKRYKRYVGKSVKLPIVGREIPIVADNMVDITYGTGAVKITPAHDLNDYDVAQRHSLPQINILNSDGTLADNAPEEYRGLTISVARQKVIKQLKEQGLLVKIKDLSHSVGHCYKCDTVIQPLLREQWFVDMKPLVEAALKALKVGEIKFYPANKLEQSIRYIETLKDWNISRQIAWGIPIPAFQNVDDSSEWIYDERITEEIITVGGKTYRRDPDVFDTWFSSSQWPYVTLDFPTGNDYKQFYPLSLMETGGDILYPWVCRMIMIGLYITGKVPFKEVYIHSTVLAADGKKMSKSIGNVVNPMPLVEKYGSDAVRMGIISGRLAGISRSLDVRRIEEARNFCNKLWNVARYIEDKLGDDFKKSDTLSVTSASDAWIILKIQQANDRISKSLSEYRFNDAYESIYHLVWDELADWYVEASKAAPNNDVLAYALETVIRLAHPFAPFVTETIWQTLSWVDDGLLISSLWPTTVPVNKPMSKDFDRIIDGINEVRLVRGILNSTTKLKLFFSDNKLIKTNAGLISHLGNLDLMDEESSGKGIRLVSFDGQAYLGLTDHDVKKFLSVFKDRVDRQKELVKKLDGRLKNVDYVKNAPVTIVNETKNELKASQMILGNLESQYAGFSKTTD